MPNQAQPLPTPLQPSPAAPHLGGAHMGLQRIWYTIAAARAGRSLALVPAEEGISTLAMAHSVAGLAAEQADSRVLLVNASIRDCTPSPVEETHAVVVRHGLSTPPPHETLASNWDYIDMAKLPRDEAERALSGATQLLDLLAAEGRRYTVAIFAVDSLLHQARGIPLVRSVDAVVLCLSLGRTSFAAAHQLVDIVGRDRILGAVSLL
jgi:hypothetical protein